MEASQLLGRPLEWRLAPGLYVGAASGVIRLERCCRREETLGANRVHIARAQLKAGQGRVQTGATLATQPNHVHR